jgi:hypothetical protein
MTDTRIQIVSTIISAKWICPVRPRNTVLEDHSIIIDENRIIDVIETKKSHPFIKPINTFSFIIISLRQVL